MQIKRRPIYGRLKFARHPIKDNCEGAARAPRPALQLNDLHDFNSHTG
jgi:hypothetical protein